MHDYKKDIDSQQKWGGAIRYTTDESFDYSMFQSRVDGVKSTVTGGGDIGMWQDAVDVVKKYATVNISQSASPESANLGLLSADIELKDKNGNKYAGFGWRDPENSPTISTGFSIIGNLDPNTITFGQSVSLRVYVHELGHVLGLDHPGGGEGDDPAYAHYQDLSIMRYGASRPVDGLLMYDIALLQQKYGVNETSVTNTWTLNGKSKVWTLWDADTNGTETIDARTVYEVPRAAGYNSYDIIDLRGLGDDGKPTFSYVGDEKFTLALDPGTGDPDEDWQEAIVIENALASKENKTQLIGNDVDNELTGGDKDDTITGGAGNDTIDGGESSNKEKDDKDIAIFTGNRADYTAIPIDDTTWQITDNRNIDDNEGTDILKNMEYAQFADSKKELITVDVVISIESGFKDIVDNVKANKDELINAAFNYSSAIDIHVSLWAMEGKEETPYPPLVSDWMAFTHDYTEFPDGSSRREVMPIDERRELLEKKIEQMEYRESFNEVYKTDADIQNGMLFLPVLDMNKTINKYITEYGLEGQPLDVQEDVLPYYINNRFSIGEWRPDTEVDKRVIMHINKDLFDMGWLNQDGSVDQAIQKLNGEVEYAQPATILRTAALQAADITPKGKMEVVVIQVGGQDDPENIDRVNAFVGRHNGKAIFLDDASQMQTGIQEAFNVTPAPINNAPTVTNDATETAHNTAVLVDVLANDSDPEEDELRIDGITDVVGGSAVIQDNKVLFTPDAGFSGEAGFSYTATDGNGNTSNAIATVTVLPAVVEEPLNLITGTTKADTLVGSAANDSIEGLAGKDLIYANEGNDVVYAGGEFDTVWGWTGDDEIYGEAGNDFLGGDQGNDSVYGGTGSDSVYGWTGDDVLYGNEGADVLSGEDGDDLLVGGASHDDLYGGAGNDTLEGGTGHDQLEGGAGADIFVFNTADDSNPAINSRDIATDFEVGIDKLQFAAATGIKSVDDLTMIYDASRNRTDIEANTTDFEVSLLGDLTATLTANDLLFVA